jgi:hypothetical protein
MAVQRSLTLIAKVIQSLANLNAVRCAAWLVDPVLIRCSSECTERGIHGRCQELLGG